MKITNNSAWYRTSEYAYYTAVMAFAVIAVVFLCVFHGTDPTDALLIRSAHTGSFRLSCIALMYIADTVLIAGWAIGWEGTRRLMVDKGIRAANIVFILCAAGIVLDAAETLISWVFVLSRFASREVPYSGLRAWSAIRDASYVFPYSAAILYGVVLKPGGSFGYVMKVFLLAGTIIAWAGVYVGPLEIPAYAWWPLFFLLLGLQLRVGNHRKKHP